MAYDSARGVTVLFGGSGAGILNGETWEWNGATWVPRLVSGPSPRCCHAMVYDAVRGVTVLFGGTTGAGNFYSGETWEWNGTVWTQRTVGGPAPRYSHAMAYDTARAVTVLYGGDLGGAQNAETWEWNGMIWNQRMVSGPLTQEGHAMVYDAVRSVTGLFGACCGDNTGKTWEWNGTTWARRVVGAPSQRTYHAMVYDAVRSTTILFGGENNIGIVNGETWEWNGTAWTHNLASGPSPRAFHAMAYDTARGFTVLFGGITDSGINDETWELGVSPCIAPSIISQPSAQFACPGASASFTTSSSGTYPLTFHWQKGGVPIDTFANPSAATPTLLLASITAANTGSYDCVVTNPCGNATSIATTLTLNSEPSISQQPSAAAACPSGTAAFSVTAVGAGLSYHWQVQTEPNTWQTLGNDPSLLPCGGGAFAYASPINSPGVNIGVRPCPGNPAAPQSLRVRCVVTDTCGSVTSDEATYKICPVDFNCSGVLSVLDIFDFLNAWFAGDLSADFNGLNGLTVTDVFDFLEAWFAGC